MEAKLTEIPEIHIKLAANIMNDNLKANSDIASEMLLNSNSEILAQAGQAMMVQANQSNSGVLSL